MDAFGRGIQIISSRNVPIDQAPWRLIVSYDGDRAMGIFICDNQLNDAVSCALEINYAIKNIAQTELSKGWTTDFKVRHVVGIGTS